jgi:hypothetical protein
MNKETSLTSHIAMDRQIEHAVTHKKPVPEIDFSLHTMEDGSQVSTLERVCKGTSILQANPLFAS